MQYMEPSFVSEDLIWPEAKPRAISHPRKQNEVPYIAYIPYYYTIYDISSTFDGILVIVRHFVFMRMRITPSKHMLTVQYS